MTLHVPAIESTRQMINEKTLALMKPDAVLINTTRGSVIDEDALVTALENGRLRAAAADVYANEPAAGDHEISSRLAQLPNFFGTHHVGASTEQAQSMIAEEVVHIIDSYVRTAQVPNCVNLVARSPAVCQLTVRYRNHTGVLAHVFHVLSDAGINTEEMGNTVFEGAKAACVRIRLDSCPTSGQLEVVRKNENVLSLDLSMIDR